ncbi:MAG: hypothetical protein ACHQ7M_06895 [Chloroflexota bacterium]
MPPLKPEAAARENIDAALIVAGWLVQDKQQTNLKAGLGVAIREFKGKSGHGFADYLLYVDGKAIGAVEAKAEGTTLSGVEPQSAKYSQGLPDHLPAWRQPLPFLDDHRRRGHPSAVYCPAHACLLPSDDWSAAGYAAKLPDAPGASQPIIQPSSCASTPWW